MREERIRSRNARAPDAVEQPVKHDVHTRRPFLLILLPAVVFLLGQADGTAGALDISSLFRSLVLGIKVDVVNLVAAATSSRTVSRPREQLAVRTPRRRSVPLPVPRQVIWFFITRRGDDPHVAVLVRVRKFQCQVARVGAPGDRADGVCLGTYFPLPVLQRQHFKAAVLERTGEARAIRRNVYAHADRVIRNERLRLERRVLPPGQILVRAARTAEIRTIAAVHHVIEAGAVRRERTTRHARKTPIRHETRLLDDRVHRIEPATARERRLHAVRTERHVAAAFRVPGG